MIQDEDIYNARILIVDDSQNNLTLLETMLSDAGFTSFISIKDPRKTMSLYGSFRPDLIILDINMPYMDGFHVMDQLQKCNKDDYVPILVITAQHDTKIKLQSLQSGAKDFLTKPFDMPETLMRIRNILEVRLLHNQAHDQNTMLEQRVKERTKDLSDAQRIAQMGNWIWDIKSSALLCSDEVYRIFGFKPQEFELTYEAFLRSIHPDDREAVQKTIKEAIYKNAPYSIEHRIVLPDGSVRTVYEQAEAVFDEDGNPAKMIGTVQDITDLETRKEELIKAQKLDAIGVLAGGIAHDFNNYLQGIMGYILLAEAEVGINDKAKHSLKQARKIILQSKELSERLITFAKGGEPIKKTVHISELLSNTISLVMSAARYTCQSTVQDNLWSVEADKGQLNQVLSNIVINAKQAMQDGGLIKVFAENTEINRSDLSPLNEGRYVKITISDQGYGISSENLQKIFDPYFTTKESGTGLGLAATFSIVKKHGGHIDVDSELGIGTNFYIYLPASIEDNPEHEGEMIMSKESAPTNSRGKILIMDDEKTFRVIIAAHLKRLNYEVVGIADGAGSIDLYRKDFDSDKPFDAVVMDLMVPGKIGGKEATAELLKIDPDARVVAISGYVANTTMAEYRKHGFRSAISKPYEIIELDEALQDAITDN